MKLLNDILNNVPEFGQLLAAMDSGRCPVALSGLSAVHRAHFAAGVYARTGRPVVLVCADEGEGERLARDLESLTGQRVPVLAPRSYIFHNAATVSRQCSPPSCSCRRRPCCWWRRWRDCFSGPCPRRSWTGPGRSCGPGGAMT